MSTETLAPGPGPDRTHGNDSLDGTIEPSGRWEALVRSILGLTNAVRELVARSPVSSEELLTAEQLGELFRISPRTLRDLAATRTVPHHRIGKHDRFSRGDIAEIHEATKQVTRDRRSYRRAAYGQPAADGWRARYRRPDGTLGSQSGFATEKAAEEWGNDQESLIRRKLWVDPRDAETPFESFAEGYLKAIRPRLTDGTAAKYRAHLDNQLLPQWAAWPLIGIFNSYVEIEKWVSELHDDYAESTVASVFATFSTFLNAAVRARIIPASPCSGVRVTAGEYVLERLVASPVRGLRAAMRLYQSGLGFGRVHTVSGRPLHRMPVE